MAVHSSVTVGLQKHFTSTELVALRYEFNKFDADNSNSIDKHELAKVVQHLGAELTEEQIHGLMLEIDEDDSGEIDWEEYLELMIKLRTGAGIEQGAVSGLLSRPPLIVVVEAELGQRKYLCKLLRQVKMPRHLIPQGHVEVVDFKSAELAMEYISDMPPSRRCALCVLDTHGILANKFCAALSAECLVPPPVVFFAMSKNQGDPMPHIVKRTVLKEQFDERTALQLVESFCIPDDVHDHTEGPTTKSGHLRKNGLIGGRGRRGHGRSHGHKGGSYRKGANITVKPRLVRPKNCFAKTRWKGALSALSPRALAQLSVVGTGGEQPKVFHVSEQWKEQDRKEREEEEERQRLYRERKARRAGEEAAARRLQEEMALPLWKMQLADTMGGTAKMIAAGTSPRSGLPLDAVRTCSGLHFVGDAVRRSWEGTIPQPPPTEMTFKRPFQHNQRWTKQKVRSGGNLPYPQSARGPRQHKPQALGPRRRRHERLTQSARRVPAGRERGDAPTDGLTLVASPSSKQ